MLSGSDVWPGPAYNITITQSGHGASSYSSDRAGVDHDGRVSVSELRDGHGGMLKCKSVGSSPSMTLSEAA